MDKKNVFSRTLAVKLLGSSDLLALFRTHFALSSLMHNRKALGVPDSAVDKLQNAIINAEAELATFVSKAVGTESFSIRAVLSNLRDYLNRNVKTVAPADKFVMESEDSDVVPNAAWLMQCFDNFTHDRPVVPKEVKEKPKAVAAPSATAEASAPANPIDLNCLLSSLGGATRRAVIDAVAELERRKVVAQLEALYPE